MPDPNNPKPVSREDQAVEIENLQITLSPWPRLAKTWKSIVALFLILLFLFLVICTLKDKLGHVSYDKFSVYFIDPGNNSVAEANTDFYQICFWTPSTNTVVTNLTAANSWQTNNAEQTIIRFGEKLRSELGIQGYRRVAVWGQGQHSFKGGYWWTVTISKYVPIKRVIGVYKEFWNPGETVYIETIGDPHSSRN